jgi:hypothetical protein
VEFRRLHDDLEADLMPRPSTEGLLVETIAVCVWCRRRILQFERGQITRRKAGASRKHLDRLMRAGNPCHTFVGAENVTAGQLEDNPFGIDRLLAELDQLDVEIECEGRLAGATVEEVQRLWQGSSSGNDPLGFWLARHNAALEEGREDGNEASVPDACREKMVALIQSERVRLLRRQEELREEEIALIDGDRGMRGTPAEQSIPSIVHYEMMLDRQMHAALDRLERLQRARMCEAAYALSRLVATASESQLRALKKLTSTRLCGGAANGITGTREVLKSGVK